MLAGLILLALFQLEPRSAYAPNPGDRYEGQLLRVEGDLDSPALHERLGVTRADGAEVEVGRVGGSLLMTRAADGAPVVLVGPRPDDWIGRGEICRITVRAGTNDNLADVVRWCGTFFDPIVVTAP